MLGKIPETGIDETHLKACGVDFNVNSSELYQLTLCLLDLNLLCIDNVVSAVCSSLINVAVDVRAMEMRDREPRSDFRKYYKSKFSSCPTH